MTFVNYYDVLQVKPNADVEVIEAAAKALLKKRHPDAGGSNTLSKSLLEARQILTDPDKRLAFDASLRAETHGNCIGNYKLIRKVAEGGFGRVYEGVHELLKEKVCIKHNINVSDFDTQLFIKEAKAIWNLRHPALPSVRDMVLLEDGSCALVMSYIEGPTLLQLVEEYQSTGKPIDPENACWIMGRVLDALRYLHYNGVVHGDVKPQNIIVQPDHHTCSLVDFGLSAVRPDKNTKPDGFTPLFASPEQLSGKPLLPESDLYSLGMTMIFALGGDVKARRVPSIVPEAVRNFIADLVVYDIRQRPHWGKVNLLESLRQVRITAFGREHSNFKKV